MPKLKKPVKQKARIAAFKLEKWGNTYHLIGTIYDHPNQSSFKTEHQLTSRLLNIDFIKMTAETLNTMYTLVNDV